MLWSHHPGKGSLLGLYSPREGQEGTSWIHWLNCLVVGGLLAKLCPTPVTLWTIACWAPLPWDSPGQNTGVGSCSLLQGIFPTQGLNSGLPHCRWILYLLSHQGSLLNCQAAPPMSSFHRLGLPLACTLADGRLTTKLLHDQATA